MAAACAICLESEEFAALPCCDGDDPAASTTRFCLECLRLLVDHGGGVARCPRCRGWISVENGAVTPHDGVGECRVCRQARVLVAHPGVCDACFLGARLPLRYECERCGRVQRIPHPMWRYQAAPDAFGHTPWACHRGCGDFTKWRVVVEDLGRVPVGDAPESWGAAWREARMRALRNGARPRNGARQGRGRRDFWAGFRAVPPLRGFFRGPPDQVVSARWACGVTVLLVAGFLGGWRSAAGLLVGWRGWEFVQLVGIAMGFNLTS
mmetsp:Transcript_32851/g.98927  ORF Transcript_32851/g.98927 Transcript_32851/m.98927 type:complete len:266 (+) Transcript_32851:1243-2040(+)